MMEIGWAAMAYAREHEMSYPRNLDVLFQDNNLTPPLESLSLVTGRPYIFPAAGRKMPSKHRALGQFILLYDDGPNEHGFHACVLGSGIGSSIHSSDLEDKD
jgi:hypothetical protein